MNYDSEFVLDEEGVEPFAVILAHILLEDIIIAGLPFMGGIFDIPILPSIIVVKVGEDADIILAPSVHVLESGVLGLVALIVDVVHGGVGGVEDAI